ncbi:MAG: ABC transporter permease [Bacteroidota bacterium]
MQKLVIDADKKSLSLNLKELYQYRDLFLILAYRDLRVRYAQTFLGILWAVIQPLATLGIFILVFGRVVKVDTGGVPYPLFALAGMSMWTYFSTVMSQAGNSIIGAQSMIQKIYFPRLVIPLSKAMVGLVDLFIGLGFLVAVMIWYRFTPSPNLFFLPLFIGLNIMAALSVGIWLSTLTIRFRDFQYVVPFMVQFGLYATPVGYPASLIPEKYRLLYFLNPMAGVIEGTRWSLFGGEALPGYAYISFGLIFVLFVSSLYYFRRTERVMADIV